MKGCHLCFFIVAGLCVPTGYMYMYMYRPGYVLLTGLHAAAWPCRPRYGTLRPV